MKNGGVLIFAYVAGGFNFAYTGYLTSLKGQITGTKTKVLDGNEETASGQVLRSAVFYDNKYRPVQTVSENYAGGGTTRISTRFSFDGLPEAVLETQIFGSATNTIAKRMEYDHARRLLKEYHKINAQVEVLLTENVYDELGKLKSKKQNTVETVNYAYNIRDWLTSAKASKLSVDLTYNFNGNIATQIAAGGNYAYTYDAANRLTAGTHSGGFTENGITYDANGNIATLNRVAGTNPGAFTYTYTGNKLTSLKVGTASFAYTYDANGNATKDGYRGMDLQYNLLNLPRKVSKGTGSVEYVYLASGAKLAKKVNGAFTQFYNGSVVYKGDKTAEYISTSEGLAMKSGANFVYQYNLSDHLGNVRVVVDAAKNTLQTTNYYPFGLAHATSALNKNKYLYNGKEIQNDLIGGTTFGMLDYGARFYDPAIGRWHSIDPLASKYAGLSGYNYGLNNPVMMIDPDGQDVILTIWTTGTGDNGVGHAGIAVSNYKQETYMETVEGVEVEKSRMVADGTYTFYDNWPGGDGVNFDLKGALTSVGAHRNIATVGSESEFTNGSTVSPSEQVAPDGVLKFATSYKQDMAVKNRIEKANEQKTDYNGAWYNCSTYASDGLKGIFKRKAGRESMLGPIKSVTPNKLWTDSQKSATRNNIETTILKDPGTGVNNKFKKTMKGR